MRRLLCSATVTTGSFDTLRESPTEAHAPVGPWLVYVGCPEDRFVGAGRSLDLTALREVRFVRGAGATVQFERHGDALEIAVGHPWVSGKHCRIGLQSWAFGRRATLEDLGSRNGTLVEDRRIDAPRALRVGEVVEIGRTFWMLRESPCADGTEATTHPLVPEREDALRAVATSEIPVLVTGGVGTGKRRLAERLHELSGRGGSLVVVHLAGYDARSLDRALLGERRSSVPGFVTQASGGTLCLLDVSSVPTACQSRLRAVLSKLSDNPERYDVRVVATSREDLRPWLDQGRYRADLYGRLAGFEVRLPTLRERRDRLGVLLRGLCQGVRESATLTTDAFRWALGYAWPYNVRQLVQAFTTAVNITGDDTIGRPALEAAVAETGTAS